LGQDGYPIEAAILCIELMGKFVKHNVATIMDIRRSAQCPIPRKNKCASRRSLTQANLNPFVYHAYLVSLPLDSDVLVRVDDNRVKAGVAVTVPV
jgi:hypothetical protein